MSITNHLGVFDDKKHTSSYMEVVLFNTCTSKLKKHVFCCGFKGKISSLRGFNTNFKYKVSRCFGGLGFYFLRNCSLRVMITASFS